MRRTALKIGGAAGVVVAAVVWGVGEARSARGIPVARPILVTRAYVDRADTLRRNETPSHLFARHGVHGSELWQLLAVADGLDPRRTHAGQVFEFRYPGGADRPDRVGVRLGDERVLHMVRDSAGSWRGESRPIRWAVELARAAGQIRSSLYETIHELVPDTVLPPPERNRLAWDLADDVYGWVVDFSRDLRAGDRIALLYERLTSTLGDVRYGRVVAARLETAGHQRAAYLLRDTRGPNAYYDETGGSLKRDFKLSPVAFRYISSGFSRSRYHPILKVQRPHLGLDYRAARGAPVVATGDGVVTRAGRWGGYGVVVTIRHPREFETRYGHLSRVAPGIRPGVRVVQGQTVGYVGMSGLATAPHVHYEFIMNGRHLDPRAAARFGSSSPVPRSRRAEFDSLRQHYDRVLDRLTTDPAALGSD